MRPEARAPLLAVLACSGASCTAQGFAQIAPFEEEQPIPAMSCGTVKSASIEAVWESYLKDTPARGLGGCASGRCHAASQGAGGLRFTSAAEFIQQTVNVSTTDDPTLMRIQMDDLTDSAVYQRVSPAAGERRMPPGGPYLDQEGLDRIAGWICSGQSRIPSSPLIGQP